jgi:hypothetical protein
LATVVERARRGERLKAIGDTYGTPTYAPHLAARLRDLAERDLPGIYHVVNAGEGTSFYDFAREAVQAARVENIELESVAMDSLSRPAPRPRNSRLRCLLSEAVGLAPLPTGKRRSENSRRFNVRPRDHTRVSPAFNMRGGRGYMHVSTAASRLFRSDDVSRRVDVRRGSKKSPTRLQRERAWRASPNPARSP